MKSSVAGRQFCLPLISTTPKERNGDENNWTMSFEDRWWSESFHYFTKCFHWTWCDMKGMMSWNTPCTSNSNLLASRGSDHPIQYEAHYSRIFFSLQSLRVISTETPWAELDQDGPLSEEETSPWSGRPPTWRAAASSMTSKNLTMHKSFLGKALGS